MVAQSKGKEGERADLTDENPFIKIHNHHNYREEILDSKVCGCFYCLEIFSPDEIFQWHGEDENGIEQVAICPRCNIDSVLGSGSGYPIEQTFLSIMRDFFFSPSGICLNQSKKVRKKLPQGSIKLFTNGGNGICFLVRTIFSKMMMLRS
jgi:hypothetical protein